ncbi:MAG: Uma2 family endonuclease [Oscillospiraceae bacterium]|nr:Uma2 family endonuclease [Oscillospiraceae bacterium]
MDTTLYPNYPNAYYCGYEDDEISIEDFESFVKHPFNKDKTFELIDGRIVLMAGNASLNHQRIVRELFKKIDIFLEGQPCEVFFDFNLYLYNTELGKCVNIYQPDIMVCCDADKITKRGYEGVPSLIVEVISKSTGKYDYKNKRENYINYNVKEYWLIDPVKNKIIVYVNDDAKSNAGINEYTFYDTVESNVFPNLSINFIEVLEKLEKSELRWFKEP